MGIVYDTPKLIQGYCIHFSEGLSDSAKHLHGKKFKGFGNLFSLKISQRLVYCLPIKFIPDRCLHGYALQSDMTVEPNRTLTKLCLAKVFRKFLFSNTNLKIRN